MMGLEEDILGLDLGNLRDASLFYSTVSTILAKMGFSHSYNHFFGVDDKFYAFRKDFDSFSRLLNKRCNLRGLSFIEVFEGNGISEHGLVGKSGTDGFVNSKVRVMTGYSDVNDLVEKRFAYYAIGSNSSLGADLPVKVRDRVLDVDKKRTAQLDFNDGFLTKVGSNHFFTLVSLYKTSEGTKPHIMPNLAFKC
jgi:hypothetical protein